MANWEFKCDKIFGIGSFSLDHNNPELFVTSQWSGVCPGCGSLYGGFRIAMAAVWSVILVASVLSDESWLDPNVDKSMWYLFLSNWSLAVMVLDSVIQAVIWIIYRAKRYRWPLIEHGILKQGKDKTLPFFFKIEWMIFNVALGSGIVSSLVDGIYLSFALTNRTIGGLFLYVFNSVYLVVNLFFVGVPLRFFHFLHTTIFLSLFVTVSALVHYVYGHSVYSFLNWSDPLALALDVSFVLLFGVVAVWAVLVMLSLVRRALTNGFGARREVSRVRTYNPYGEASG